MKIVIVIALFLAGCDRCVDGSLYYRNGDVFVKSDKKCLTLKEMTEKLETSKF